MSELERLRNKVRLAGVKEDAAKQKLKLEGLRDSLRNNLDEFEPVDNLKLTLVAEQAIEAAELQIQYLETLATIAAIEKALG